MQKEVEISQNKVYNLPDFTIIEYQEYFLAVAVNFARWLVLTNRLQLDILNMLQKKKSIGEIFELYKNEMNNIVHILTQIEAVGFENLTQKSIFENKRLHLHLTNQCNLHCPHCYMKSGIAYEDELTTDEIKKLCKDFSSIGGNFVSISGGEPILRTDFYEIVKYISDLGMDICIFSNGIAWDEKMIKQIAALHIEGIQISIDGYDEASNARIRGGNSFNKALNTADLLIKHGIPVKIAVTPLYDMLQNHTEDYIKFATDLLKKYGTQALSINFSYGIMPGRKINADKIEQTKKDYHNLVDQITSAIYKDISLDSFVDNIIDTIYDSCGYGGLNILANGDIYFCDRIPNASPNGNIRKNSFSEIYELMKIAENAGKIDNFKPCSNCALKYICGGGCRVDFFNEFVKIPDVKRIDFDKIPARICSQEHKEAIYSQMIQTYERFYR